MKQLLSFISFTVLIILCLESCKKDIPSITSYASLKIVNCITGGINTKLNNYTSSVPVNGHFNYIIMPGNTDIYVWPFGDSLHPYYDNKGTMLEERGLYSLFLGGTPGAVEGLLIKENFPYRIDSTAAIRFVHLSPGGPPVNVTLSTSATVNEFSGVVYKGITEFKYLPAAMANTSYTFQVRNANTNAIISSITMSGTALASFVPRFRFVTLVLRGKVGGTPVAGITRVNHY